MASEPLFYVMFHPPREWYDQLVADTAAAAPRTTLEPYSAYPRRSTEIPMTRADAEWFIRTYSGGHADWYHLQSASSPLPVTFHAANEPLPAGVSWTADDETDYTRRLAQDFPVRDYEDQGSAGHPVGLAGEDAAVPARAASPADPSPFTPVRTRQFVSGFQETTRAIEADR